MHLQARVTAVRAQFPETGDSTERIPVFSRLRNPRAVFVGQHEIIRLLAAYALGKKRLDFGREFDPATFAILGSLQSEPMVEQIDVAPEMQLAETRLLPLIYGTEH